MSRCRVDLFKYDQYEFGEMRNYIYLRNRKNFIKIKDEVVLKNNIFTGKN